MKNEEMNKTESILKDGVYETTLYYVDEPFVATYYESKEEAEDNAWIDGNRYSVECKICKTRKPFKFCGGINVDGTWTYSPADIWYALDMAEEIED